MIIKIKIADANIGFEEDTLKTVGLGSCCAVTLFDRERRIGGMIHYMLPTRLLSSRMVNPYKYCDTGLKMLIDKMEIVGSRAYRMEAKIVGGANMFSDLQKNEEDSIGHRNTKAAKEILREYRIPIIADDTGDNYSRSVELIVKTGLIKVSSFKAGEVEY